MKFGVTPFLAATIGILALAASSDGAETGEKCVLRCDWAFSKTLNSCILPYRHKPKNPHRVECLDQATDVWVNCKENCYD
ncbi:hypothetical protein DFQ27_003950 [Actinomortierella ambigua]|uniref:Uncharacterized protein n=1 Tax=Actinomortierella ambigua TaxID=1343610 RepID=A0A9P6Q5X3_9FUNG|nr:hypothetical protein DFQ27_003950 [Actinomortierella ambigua]